MAILFALCASHALPEASTPPARLMIMPAPKGPTIRGKDGRAWTLTKRDAVLRAANARPVQLDTNHAAVHRAPKGEDSPAAAWLSGFEFDTDGALWASKVEWTPYGERLHADKAYRFLSPALLYDSKSGTSGVLGEITGLHSVGLVNDPNFVDLPALNAAETQDPQTMTPEQLKALGLAADATQEQINARLAQLSNPLDAIRDMLTAVVASVKPTAKSETAPNAADESHTIAVNAVVNAGIVAGKVAPASRESLVAMGGTTSAQLKALDAYITGLPVIAPNKASAPAKVGTNGAKGDKSTVATGVESLSEHQLALCANLGIKPEDFLKTKGEFG